tara:strand:- start:489 stop:734 length:246 start_codon:yes stop_codon:yes gene_type:complete
VIEDIVGGIFKILGRFIGQIFIEVIFELLLKGPGYFISKQFTKRDPDPDGFAVVLSGFVFWLIIGATAYGVYSNFGGGGNA